MVGNTLNPFWLAVGFGGQALFGARFVIQWIASERRKKSVVPHLFWFFSLLGGMALLAYAIHKKDPVFITGQALGLMIYSRNLWFIYGRKEAGSGTEGGTAATPSEVAS